MFWIEALIVVVLSLSMVALTAWIVCKLYDVADCLQGEVTHKSGHTFKRHVDQFNAVAMLLCKRRLVGSARRASTF